MPTDNSSFQLISLLARQRSTAGQKLARRGDRLLACPVGVDADIPVVEVDGRVAMAWDQADLVADIEPIGGARNTQPAVLVRRRARRSRVCPALSTACAIAWRCSSQPRRCWPAGRNDN